ncbi:DUF2971 domain-containing protein [Teichococcus rhizosphaerae]|uniref:DUF2971 domain-containing protein n=1 Tax=Teichococcus rhizosphaerae TaxID=1335062 RepID=UPI0011453FAC|nr:DUF2971 domain-containing protein [Pseudoroseomonas rhizosphaerae]
MLSRQTIAWWATTKQIWLKPLDAQEMYVHKRRQAAPWFSYANEDKFPCFYGVLKEWVSWHETNAKEDNINTKQKENNSGKNVYHYTDANGLIGIMKNESLWATNVNFLNDRREFSYVRDLFEESVQEIDDTKKKLLEKISNYHNSWLENSDIDGVFVLCFCEDGNLLSQWRSYAGSGAGYALGFKKSDLFEANSIDKNDEAAKEIFFRKIIYDKDYQIEWVNKFL